MHPDLLSLSVAILPASGTEDLARVLDVPLSSEGFYMESHLKMRPMDFAREGMFVCGVAHYPKFIEECISSAQAAAGRVRGLSDVRPYLPVRDSEGAVRGPGRGRDKGRGLHRSGAVYRVRDVHRRMPSEGNPANIVPRRADHESAAGKLGHQLEGYGEH